MFEKVHFVYKNKYKNIFKAFWLFPLKIKTFLVNLNGYIVELLYSKPYFFNSPFQTTMMITWA